MWIPDEDFELLERALVNSIGVELGRAGKCSDDSRPDKQDRHMANALDFRELLRRLRLTKRTEK